MALLEDKLTDWEIIRFSDIMRRFGEEYPQQKAGDLIAELQKQEQIPEGMGVLSELANEIKNAIVRRCLTLSPGELSKLKKDDMQPLLKAIFKLHPNADLS